MTLPTLNDKIVWHTTSKDKDLYIWITPEHCKFNAVIKLKGIVIYSKSIKYEFESFDGTKIYEVFPEDLVYMMQHMENGVVAGAFEYTKKGYSQFGIKMVHPAIN